MDFGFIVTKDAEIGRWHDDFSTKCKGFIPAVRGGFSKTFEFETSNNDFPVMLEMDQKNTHKYGAKPIDDQMRCLLLEAPIDFGDIRAIHFRNETEMRDQIRQLEKNVPGRSAVFPDLSYEETPALFEAGTTSPDEFRKHLLKQEEHPIDFQNFRKVDGIATALTVSAHAVDGEEANLEVALGLLSRAIANIGVADQAGPVWLLDNWHEISEINHDDSHKDFNQILFSKVCKAIVDEDDPKKFRSVDFFSNAIREFTGSNSRLNERQSERLIDMVESLNSTSRGVITYSDMQDSAVMEALYAFVIRNVIGPGNVLEPQTALDNKPLVKMTANYFFGLALRRMDVIKKKHVIYDLGLDRQYRRLFMSLIRTEPSMLIDTNNLRYDRDEPGVLKIVDEHDAVVIEKTLLKPSLFDLVEKHPFSAKDLELAHSICKDEDWYDALISVFTLAKETTMASKIQNMNAKVKLFGTYKVEKTVDKEKFLNHLHGIKPHDESKEMQKLRKLLDG